MQVKGRIFLKICLNVDSRAQTLLQPWGSPVVTSFRDQTLDLKTNYIMSICDMQGQLTTETLVLR